MQTSLDIYPLQRPHPYTAHSSTLTCTLIPYPPKQNFIHCRIMGENNCLQCYDELFISGIWLPITFIYLGRRHSTGERSGVIVKVNIQIRQQAAVGLGFKSTFFVIRRCSNFVHSQRSSNELTMDSNSHHRGCSPHCWKEHPEEKSKACGDRQQWWNVVKLFKFTLQEPKSIFSKLGHQGHSFEILDIIVMLRIWLFRMILIPSKAPTAISVLTQTN